MAKYNFNGKKKSYYRVIVFENSEINLTLKYYKCKIMNHKLNITLVRKGEFSVGTKEMAIVLFGLMVSLSGCQQLASHYESTVLQSKQEIQDECQEMAKSYKDIYEKAKQEHKLGDLETVRAIVQRLGESGYTAVDGENEINMVNAEVVEQFCKKAKAGQACTVSFITVMYNGDFVRYDLMTHESQLIVTTTAMIWNEGKMETTKQGDYETCDWGYSEEGYLFLEQYRPIAYDGPSGHKAIRVKPIDETLRVLNRKYLKPIRYDINNMFITDWDETNYNNLSFYDLYEIMYEMKYGEKAFDPYDTFDQIHEVPKNQFEEVFKTYLKVNAEQIQKNTNYHAESKTYEYRRRGVYDCLSTATTPYPEVIAVDEKNDGTIKLIVQAVWPEENLSVAFKHEVDIRPLENGGFQYVSNHVIPSQRNVEAEWYDDRLTDEEWEACYGEIK